MHRLTLLPPAETDLQDARAWYVETNRGLSDDFMLCIEETLARIKRNPLAFPLLSQRIRRAIIHRFPYQILFFIETDHVYVIAVLHQRRNPLHWQKRMH